MILVLPRRRICDARLCPETDMGTPYLWVGAVRMISLRERLSLLRLQRLFILALNTPSPFPKEGAELGDGNERTGDEAPSRRE